MDMDMNANLNFLNVFKTSAEKVEKGISFSNLSLETEVSSLGLDSVSVMEIVGEIEDQLKIVIPDEKLARLRTLGDIEKAVREQSQK